jgi:hypothetical protein
MLTYDNIKKLFQEEFGKVRKTLQMDIKKGLDEGFEKQAVLINNAFQSQQEYMDGKFLKIEERLDTLEGRFLPSWKRDPRK